MVVPYLTVLTHLTFLPTMRILNMSSLLSTPTMHVFSFPFTHAASSERTKLEVHSRAPAAITSFPPKVSPARALRPNSMDESFVYHPSGPLITEPRRAAGGEALRLLVVPLLPFAFGCGSVQPEVTESCSEALIAKAACLINVAYLSHAIQVSMFFDLSPFP